MKIKPAIILGLKLILLTFLLFVANMIGTKIAGMSDTSMTPNQASQIVQALLGIYFLHITVLAYPILRSCWGGWRLMSVVAAVMFGITYFLSQIESLLFLKYFTAKMTAVSIFQIIVSGAITALIFAPLAVLILGKLHAETPVNQVRRLNMPWSEWAWKLGVIAVGYYLIYMIFGFFVAWQSPAVRSFYSGMDAPFWMIPLVQFGRGLIWAGLAVPVVKMMKGRNWETGLAVALLYSVLMGSLLLLPYNPIMPEAVRLAHLKEILSSNFIFGWLVVWILNLGRKPQQQAVTVKA